MVRFWVVAMVLAIPAAMVLIAALIHIALARLNQTARAIWVLVVLLFPIVGGIAWWVVGAPSASRAARLPLEPGSGSAAQP